jgi:hypothetical protein
MGLLKIDFKNAFNMVERAVFLREVAKRFPGMSPWTEWCYGTGSVLLYDHHHVIDSLGGVQQGDPLGPLYFCCALDPLVDEITSLGPVYNKWYMDDGGIIGSPELLQRVWDLLRVKGPPIGLHLNPSKCEWSWLDPHCSAPCPLVSGGVQSGVPVVPTDQITMLGVPLGSPTFSSCFVGKKLLPRLGPTIDRLTDFEDSQAAFFLLRTSYGVVRATHFMRTTPLEDWHAQAEGFDGMIRSAAERILGFPFSDQVSPRVLGAWVFVGHPFMPRLRSRPVGVNPRARRTRCGLLR